MSMVAAALLRLAPIALKGAARGVGAVGKAAFGPAKGFPGGMVGQELFKYGVVAPVAGAAFTSVGLPWGFSKPAAPAAAPAGPGMMTPRQQDFMYGELGAGPFGSYLPWQNKGPGFMDRQLQAQERMFNQGQQTARYAAGMSLQGVNIATGRQLQGMMDSNRSAVRIADLSTGRQLEGLRDTNRTRTALADRELSGLYDTNRSRVRMADIGARRDMYLADRSVEVARWGGAPARVATFGSLMGTRY